MSQHVGSAGTKAAYRIKIGALVLALVMVLAMSSTAFAAVTDGNDANDQETGTVYDGDKTHGFDAIDETVKFPKTIIVYNDDDSATVYAPKITYTYTITPAGTSARSSSGVTVTDSDGDSATVYDGIAAAVAGKTTATTTEVEFNNEAVTGSLTAGVEITGYVEFDFTPANFGHAGIFRYLIAETADDRDEAGVVSEGTYAANRYLDVYVHNNATTGDLEVYGYVLFEPDGTDDEDENITTGKTKSAGYVDTNTSTGITNVADVDVYYTDNVTLTKSITGLGNKTHAFTFNYSITQDTTHSDVDASNVRVVHNGTAAQLDTILTTADFTRALADGDTITLVGVARAALITIEGIYETNDTWDDYHVTAIVNSTTNINNVTVGHNKNTQSNTEDTTNGVAGAGTQSVLIGTTENTGEEVITFENNMTEISPTGVVMRIAPYALMLAAGFVILLIARRRKEDPEEA